MRFVFINLHSNVFFVKTLRTFILNESSARKNEYLLDYLLENKYKVCSLVNERGTTFFGNGRGILYSLYALFRFCEHYYVMWRNNKKDIVLLHDENEIRKDDIVIYYTHYPNQFISHPKLGKRIVSLLHFYGIKEDCLKISDIQPDVLFTAADLRKYSKLYKKNLDDLACNYLLLPFVYEERFRITVPFKERKNKAMAIGTVTYFKNEEFKKMYSTYCYQPLRKQIYDNKERLSRYIDCYIMPYKEDREKEVKTGDNIFLRSYYWIVNHFNNSQRKYFSFDMVDKFNEYKIAICPEDAQGMPGIGFVEAMASGCAFLGLKYGAYEDLGLIEGVHYIAYDGSITDLRAKIEYYTSQEHQKELSNIAQNGYEYVKNNFNKEIVAKRFVDYFERLLDVNER